MRRKKLFFVIGPLAIVAIALLIAVGGEIVMQLWNWLLPSLFGWRQITFWQALGILVLARILFGGHGPWGRGLRRRMSDRMADRMRGRWERMTPEERERFRQGMRGGGCGPWPADSRNHPPASPESV